MAMMRWSVLASCSLVALLLVSNSASAQKTGGTLVQIAQPEPPNLAPYISTSAPIGQVTAKVYDGLLEYGFDLKPKPSLAESWDVAPDGKTVTFKLRRDVIFHDGKPFTSAALSCSHPRTDRRRPTVAMLAAACSSARTGRLPVLDERLQVQVPPVVMQPLEGEYDASPHA